MTCPIPKLMFHGSFEKKFALTSMALLRSRSPENVVLPRTVSGSGTSYRTLASRRTWAPSSSADTTGSSPQASSVGVSPGETGVDPGVRVERQLVDDRPADEGSLLVVGDRAAAPVERADDRVGERGPVEGIAAEHEVDLGRLAGRDVADLHRRDAEHDRRRDQRPARAVGDRALDPSAVEPQVGGHRRAGGAGLGADGAHGTEADGEVADARRVALEDVEVAAAVARTSPFIGAARRASPATRSW